MEGIEMEVLEQELNETIKVWPVVSKLISTIHTEEQYNKVVKLLDKLIDEVSEKEDPLIETLIDTLGILIKDYEDRTIPEPKGDPIGCLKFLMEEHGINESGLKELGSPKVISEILDGKRNLNLRQIKALSKRFHISPAVFMEDE